MCSLTTYPVSRMVRETEFFVVFISLETISNSDTITDFDV